MDAKAFVVGVGMTRFEKPGSHARDYPALVHEAGTRALGDAGVDYAAIEQVYAGYCYGDSASGQRAVYGIGLSGVPLFNVNNYCATGSSALFLARQAVQSGVVECALAVGFERMSPGSIDVQYPDRAGPLDRHFEVMEELRAREPSPWAPEMFGNAGREHMERYGSTPEHFAWIGWKSHRHSVNNEYAQFQREYTLEEVRDSRPIHLPLTKLQCSPTSDGAACAVIASERFVEQHGLADRAVEIVGQAMATDRASSFDEASCIKLVGFDLSRRAAELAYEQASVGPADLDVIELHDCFSTNELLSYEALGLAEEGHGHELVDRRDTTYGGRWVVNPSGGLISKGHPLGATGLAQCSELVWQLRGTAGARQVAGARVALQHNIGLGGAAVVTIYQPAVLQV